MCAAASCAAGVWERAQVVLPRIQNAKNTVMKPIFPSSYFEASAAEAATYCLWGKQAHTMTLVRIFDPYAMALSFLVGGVGFGMTFFFNTNVPGWGMHEIGYPAMAMVS